MQTGGDLREFVAAREAGAATYRLTLQDALGRLTPRQRAVLVLRFYEDLTEAQVAAARESVPDAMATFAGVES